jgi:uncharacterized protein (TIGR00290 family)
MRVVMSWSGGKDSAQALRALQNDHDVEIAALLTTITEGYERVSMHALRVDLLRAQAAATGLPLVEVRIPPDCVNQTYRTRMASAISSEPIAGVEHHAFGDLFLEDVRAYREETLAAVGKEAVFPLWGQSTEDLAYRFIADGFRAIVTCVDPTKLDPSFVGREYDAGFLDDLPPTVDPCGENGEFHTFVYDGPIFDSPIGFAHGETVERDGFFFHDVTAPTSTPTTVGA